MSIKLKVLAFVLMLLVTAAGLNGSSQEATNDWRGIFAAGVNNQTLNSLEVGAKVNKVSFGLKWANKNQDMNIITGWQNMGIFAGYDIVQLGPIDASAESALLMPLDNCDPWLVQSNFEILLALNRYIMLGADFGVNAEQDVPSPTFDILPLVGAGIEFRFP